MTASTQSAPVRHWHAGTRATRNPSLIRKARTVDPIMHQRLARREQRRAARLTGTDNARRLARLEVELVGLSAQVTADSILLGTAATPAVITAQTCRSDEAACAALAELIWTPAERLEFGTLMPAPDLEPAMSGPVFTCWCGAQSSNGCCPLGHAS